MDECHGSRRRLHLFDVRAAMGLPFCGWHTIIEVRIAMELEGNTGNSPSKLCSRLDDGMVGESSSGIQYKLGTSDTSPTCCVYYY